MYAYKYNIICVCDDNNIFLDFLINYLKTMVTNSIFPRALKRIWYNNFKHIIYSLHLLYILTKYSYNLNYLFFIIS